MKRTGILILLLLLTALSCGPRADIPEKKMIQIYYEISLLDNYVDYYPEMRAQSDSMRVYAPLLDKYGYTEEEFINSIHFYLRDPERFLKMIKAVETKLKEREEYLTELQQADGDLDRPMMEEAVDFDEGAPVEEHIAFPEQEASDQDTSVQDISAQDTSVQELPDTKNRRTTTREKRLTKEELLELSKKFKQQKTK
ncbi:MAG: DUF4296 domain-containing protein [Bacteroidales bacterium]|jgi:hypothetical protein|nr:DUF4296 domain-containing protein [Bacteroidales bacterium]